MTEDLKISMIAFLGLATICCSGMAVMNIDIFKTNPLSVIFPSIMALIAVYLLIKLVNKLIKQ